MTITYNGTTAGSTSANPPLVVGQTMANVTNSPGLTGGKIWFYTSTNVAADLTAPAAFTDGHSMGMKVGDIMLGVTSSAGSSAPIFFAGVVGLVTASSGAGLSSNVLTSTAV
jgi:hypothetical protein